MLAGKTVGPHHRRARPQPAVCRWHADCGATTASASWATAAPAESTVPVLGTQRGARHPVGDRHRRGGLSQSAVGGWHRTCWGDNGFGQLGNNSTTGVDRAGGGVHRPSCWPTTSPQLPPVPHSLPWPMAPCPLGPQLFRPVGRRQDDGQRAVAVNPTGRLSGSTVSPITAGAGHTCAVLAEWHRHLLGRQLLPGQLGNATNNGRPLVVANPPTPTAVRGDHGCHPDHRRHLTTRVRCWPGAPRHLLGLQRLRSVGQRQHHRLEQCRWR